MAAEQNTLDAVLSGDPVALGLVGVIVAALLVGAVAVWLIVRARKPARIPVLKDVVAAGAAPSRGGLWRRLRDALDAMVAALRYFSSRREWRYAMPWMLVCGERGAGKSSLIASISDGRRRQHLTPQEEALAVAGTALGFFDRGVLIDVDGSALPADVGKSENRKWKDVMRGLVDERPERALDGVVLAISARTLLGGTAADVQRLAEQCQSQLWQLQEHLEFAFPVYVVVTQCDVVDGFEAYWTAQPASRREEIVGWSSPYAVENSFVPEWIDTAFEQIGASLKRLQLQAAAGGDDIQAPDAFFLFPQQFRALRAPLRAALGHMFRASTYRQNSFFRGVYFTGRLATANGAAPGPRRDIAFGGDLFDEKVFAELHLAQTTRQALWSRHRLIRRVQFGAAAAFMGLCLALTYSGWALNQQVDAGIASVNLIRNPQRLSRHSGSCVGKETVYELLTNVASLDVGLVFWPIPASWVDRRISDRGIDLIAGSAFEDVIFPSLACHLEVRARRLLADTGAIPAGDADSLTVDRRRLQAYVDRVLEFERNLARFRRIVLYASRDRSEELLQKFEVLAQYLYGQPLPSIVQRKQGQHREALTRVVYKKSLDLPGGMRAHIGDRITSLAAHTRAEIDREISTGETLLAALSRDRGNNLAAARGFAQWLALMREGWLIATDSDNPCLQVDNWLRAATTELHRDFGYAASLIDEANAFDTEQCYTPSVRRLAELHVAPHGVLFRREGQGWALTPAIAAEADGLARFAALDYAQIEPHEPFVCQLPLRGWRNADLVEAQGFVREYQEFVRVNAGDAGDATAPPLYVSAARQQLRAVLDDTLNRAQRPARYGDVGAGTLVDPLSSADQALQQQSADFSVSVEPLLWLLRMYQQLGFEPSRARIAQCTRNYAAHALDIIKSLGESSRVYEPGIDPAVYDTDEDQEARPFFAIGTAPQAQDYLDRQLQRTQILASYAAPFVAFLKNTDGVGATSGAYWDNTIQQLNALVQFKVPNGQAALLNDFVLKQLPKLTPKDCDQVLLSYTPGAYGDDLFSDRRRRLERQSNLYCHDRARAQVYAQYQTLAQQYGADLAGRFPFGETFATDAAPGAARAWFQDYDQNRKALEAKLKGLKGAESEEVRNFIDALDESAAFFSTNLAAKESVQPVRVKVEFRPRRVSSTGAENVVRWRLRAGDNAISYPNGGTDLDWRFGESVALELTWADLAPAVPLADPKQTDMRVDGNTVTFEASDAWALFKLVQRHAPLTAARFDPADPNAVLLEFRVPTRAKNGAPGAAPTYSRLYLSLRFYGVDPKTRAAVALKWPRAFPADAPVIW